MTITRLMIDVTSKCNLNCRMCYIGDSGRQGQDMPLYAYRKIAEQVFPYLNFITISCGYEALMAENILDMINIAGEHDIEKKEIMTNGMLLDEKIIRAIIEFRLTNLLVSFDGASKETYEQIRRGSDFNRIMDNIRLLNRIKRECNVSYPTLVFSVTLMRSNIDELPGIMEIAKDNEAGRLLVKAVHVHNRYLENESLDRIPEKTKEVLLGAQRKAEMLDVELMLTPETLCYLDAAGAAGEERPGCKQNPFESMVIWPSGEVYPCVFWRKGPVGDFRTQDFDEIWNSREYREFRDNLRNGKFDSDCNRCIYSENRKR